MLSLMLGKELGLNKLQHFKSVLCFGLAQRFSVRADCSRYSGSHSMEREVLLMSSQ